MPWEKEFIEKSKGSMCVPYHIGNVTEAILTAELRSGGTIDENTSVSKIVAKKVIENGEEGFVVGDKVSLADVVLYVTMTQTFDDAARAEKARESCPKMKKVIESVENLPGIQTWLASRPENRF